MSETDREESIVVTALVGEYVRTRNRRDGAEKRLLYAESQAANETALLEETSRHLTELEAAILAHGGKLPHAETQAEQGDGS